jgi:coatomer subunit beta'
MVGEMVSTPSNSVYKLQRQLFARSERVKGIDFHPVEPWILTTLYSGMLKRIRCSGHY